MTKIDAIFFDIDGTLVDMATRSVPESTIKSLNLLRERGIKLFICSGRHPSFRETLMKEVGFDFDGYIFLNGQYITDNVGNTLYKLPFSKDTRLKFRQFLKRNKWLMYTVMEEDYVYNPRLSKNMHKEFLNVDTIDRFLDHDVYQICPYGPKIVDKLILRKNPGAKSARWHKAFADIIPSNGGKDKGILRVCEIYNLNIENTMAFGDAANDIPMLKGCKIGVVMGNGTKEAKEVGDYITTSTSNDGIYNALKHFEVI